MSSYKADRLRVAVALVALKFKPSEQSVAAYVLDIRSKFVSSKPSPPTSDGSWRNRALELEGEVISLKAQVEGQEVGRMSELNADTEKVSEEPPKKRQKKKAANALVGASGQGSSIEAVLKSISSISGSESLLGAITTFDNLMNTANPSRELISSIAARALDAIVPYMLRMLDPTKVGTMTTSHQDTIRTLSMLMHHVLSACLPHLGTRKKTLPRAAQDLVLDKCISSVSLPIVKAFYLLSIHYATTMVSPPTSRAKASVDIRPDLLHLTRVIMEDLCTAPSMREALAVQVSRELHTILTATNDTDDRTRRIHGIARKDSLWYLCSLLHLLFVSPQHPSSHPAGYLMQEALNALCHTLMQSRSSRSTHPEGIRSIGEMEYNMVLATVETFWRFRAT